MTQQLVLQCTMTKITDVVLAFTLWPVVILLLYIRFILAFIICLPWLLYALSQGKGFGDFIGLYSVMERAPFGLGKYVYTGFTGFFSPNNCLFTPVIRKLNSNVCVVSQSNYFWHRNPFGCMHAVCITNTAEYCSGLAMLAAFQAMKNVKGIVVSFNINFHAKCKGEARAVLEIDPKLIKDDTKGNSTWENKINVFDQTHWFFQT